MRPGIVRPKDCYLCKSPDIREDLLHRFPVCHECADRYKIGTFIADPKNTPPMYPGPRPTPTDDIYSFYGPKP